MSLSKNKPLPQPNVRKLAMMPIDLAHRVYTHSFKLDPIIRSLLDTDFYKLLMLQMIWGLYPKIDVTFSLINRSPHIFLAEEIEEKELRAQLDYARTLRFSKKEMIWLRGNNFYGRQNIFHSDFLLWLQNFQLPPYHLERKNGHYILKFTGSWTDVTMWEIPALAIINELRSRSVLKNMGRFSLDVLYARAKAKVWSKVETLKKLEGLKIADFGTRRRHSFLWQRWCVEALKEGLGKKFIGTSNMLHAMQHDLDAIGTNAHELPMVLTAIAPDDEAKKVAPYQVLRDWQRYYDGNLLICLPDTFGTKNFLQHAPDWLANWRGFRLDSADPIERGELVLAWWQEHNQNPKDKLLVFSDALNVEMVEKIYHHFLGRVQLSFGWGTKLTNDFAGCAPLASHLLDPSSLVCKVTCANGQPAVKLSDDLSKATGTTETIAYYKHLFQTN